MKGGKQPGAGKPKSLHPLKSWTVRVGGEAEKNAIRELLKRLRKEENKVSEEKVKYSCPACGYKKLLSKELADKLKDKCPICISFKEAFKDDK